VRLRKATLLQLAGVPWPRVGEQVGQRSLAVTANTYSHVMLDQAEVDYAQLLRAYQASQNGSRGAVPRAVLSA
jgi:hypothetical protein